MIGLKRCEHCNAVLPSHSVFCCMAPPTQASAEQPCGYCGGEGKRVEDGLQYGCAQCGGSGVVEAEQPQGEGLSAQITEYLSRGGLFNPESMEHSKVKDLLISCRSELDRVRQQLAEAQRVLEKHACRADVAESRLAAAQGLVEKWRLEAAAIFSDELEYHHERVAVRECADELAAALGKG